MSELWVGPAGSEPPRSLPADLADVTEFGYYTAPEGPNPEVTYEWFVTGAGPDRPPLKWTPVGWISEFGPVSVEPVLPPFEPEWGTFAQRWVTGWTATLHTELLAPLCRFNQLVGIPDAAQPYIDIYPRGELIDRGQLPARCDRRTDAAP
jgi:hypothetical protein